MTQDRLGDELVSAISWLTSAESFSIVMGSVDKSIHVYRGQAHESATRQSEDEPGAAVFLRAVQATRRVHGD
jgi:hypothetical protein